MRFLITGGAGFIGSHLSDLLLEKKFQVIIIDDLSSGNIENLQISKVEFINKKIQNVNIESLGSIDGIFHLASQVSVKVSVNDFYESSRNNIDSSLKVIDIARKLNIPLIYASSSAIYGDSSICNEEMNNYNLLSPYALDKSLMEQYCSMANKLYGLSSIGLRFFNVYGSRQDGSNPYSGVISIFIDKLIKDEEIIVRGGYQTRDFVYIDDVVNTLYTAMKLAKETTYCTNINVGTGVSTSINELVQILSEIIGESPKIKYEKLPIEEIKISIGTYEKLNNILNINSKQFINIKDGLHNTIESKKYK